MWLEFHADNRIHRVTKLSNPGDFHRTLTETHNPINIRRTF
jgi:hypothetical protein